ncbi:hypothetical protein PUMCH_002493 [Australozyma saopauloensis]|uniref:Acyl-coenzyme A diphosphatase SCS3 n=1 Tax=Australozyma saopauloensis TaxID=291208 RepID=A0AAX4H9P6_9ASCO|nr:hypothetical protein PUMCH_002493 [[Candida] saopauloensis]
MLNTQQRYQQRYHHLSRINTLFNVFHRHKLSTAEVLYIGSFVLNFITGKLLHVLSQKEEVYNYYNDKGNIFNQYFVKKGWAWTTLGVFFFYIVKAIQGSLDSTGGVNDKNGHGKRMTVARLCTAALRYVVATVWWILFTQWCFGVPIMDKVFLFTGGKCASISEDRLLRYLKGKLLDHKIFLKLDTIYESTTVSSQVCRRLRGSWEGGHDPLGHVFLLVHSSLYLFFELTEHWNGASSLFSDFRRIFGSKKTRLGVWSFVKQNPEVPLLMLMALWWFMLLMTNMYFHLLAEKLVGLAFGYFGVFLVYIAPRWLN